jgi:hypothetical protein
MSHKVLEDFLTLSRCNSTIFLLGRRPFYIVFYNELLVILVVVFRLSG